MAANEFDVVVAGAGHNSLIAACYLAKAGLEVCVLEARDLVGGDTATEELTLPGFLHDSCSTAHVLIQSSPTIRDDELGLQAEYGLEYLRPERAVVVPFLDGASITQWRDRERTWEELARFSRRDADAFVRMLEEYHEVRGAFAGVRNTPLGAGPTLEQRLAGRPDAHRWLRRQQESAWEAVMDRFEDWHVQAFMLWMAELTMQPVEQPGTALLAWSLPYGRDQHGWAMPRGGSGALPQACVRLLEAHGATILTGRQVSGLVLEDGHCAGVETERRRAVPRPPRGALVDPRQAPGRDGAGGPLGRRARRCGRRLARGRDDVRHPLRDERAAALRGGGRRPRSPRSRWAPACLPRATSASAPSSCSAASTSRTPCCSSSARPSRMPRAHRTAGTR